MRHERQYRPAPTETRTCTRCGNRFETSPNDPYNTCSADCEQPRPALRGPVYLSADQVRAFVEATHGAAFAVEFIKKDSSRRLMYARTGDCPTFVRVGLATVWDVENGSFRNIPLDRVISFAIASESKTIPAYQIPVNQISGLDPFRGF